MCSFNFKVDVSISKVDLNIFKEFFKTYTNFDVPCSTSLRKNFSEKIHDETLNEALELLYKKRIYTIIDELQDAAGNTVAGLIVGNLDHPQKGPFLIHLKKIGTSCDTKAYTEFYLEGLKKIYPDGKIFNIRYIFLFTKYLYNI